MIDLTGDDLRTQFSGHEERVLHKLCKKKNADVYSQSPKKAEGDCQHPIQAESYHASLQFQLLVTRAVRNPISLSLSLSLSLCLSLPPPRSPSLPVHPWFHVSGHAYVSTYVPV